MLHIYTKVPSKISTIIVGFDAGARAEGEEFSQGIAHMLEHMMFKGTEKRHYLDIPKEIGFLGGDSNAFTSHEMVAYYISVPYENLRPAMDILSDMIFNSTFPEEEFLKEREVVLEEEASSCDNVGPFIMRRLSREFFSGRIAQPIIGTQETISGFTREELVAFYDKRYSPSNMIVSLASNLPIREGKKVMREYFGRSTGRIKHDVDTHMPAYGHTRTLNIHRPMIEHSYVYHTYPGPTVADVDEVATDVMLEILGQGMDSRLFTEVREKNGLCYHIGAMSHSLRDQGAVMIASSTRGENVEPMNDLIFKEVSRMKNEKVSEEEIQKAINQHKADTYRVMESSKAYASWNLNRSFFGQSSIEEYDERINAITPNDILDAARRHFDDDRRLTLICSEGN
jgi:predicted Zn-dependent peptidase